MEKNRVKLGINVDVVKASSSDTTHIFISGDTNEYSNVPVLISDYLAEFDDEKSSITPHSWVICGNQILANAEENYQFKSTAPILH